MRPIGLFVMAVVMMAVLLCTAPAEAGVVRVVGKGAVKVTAKSATGVYKAGRFVVKKAVHPFRH